MASRKKRTMKSLLKDAAVFTAVILTNIVPQIVAIANALEPENLSTEGSTSGSAQMKPPQPNHHKPKRENKHRHLIREYSRSLCESYVPTISALLDEEAELARSKQSSNTSKADSILDINFDYTDRMWQTGCYFADWESYPVGRNALGLEESGTLAGRSGSGRGEDDGAESNPWRSAQVPNAI